MAAALVCGGCSQAGMVVGTAPAELPMPKQIDVVFNHNARSRYRSPLTGEWRNGDNMEEAWLVKAIDGATEEVLVAIQELSLPRVAQALIAAKHRRGPGSTEQQTQAGRLFQDWSLQQTCQTESLCSTKADQKPGHSKHTRRNQRFSQASV